MSPTLLLINPAMAAGGAPASLLSSAIVSPGPARLRRKRRAFNAGGMVTMEPLALAYVAALTPPHWQVRIVDEVWQDMPDDLKPDLVALTSLSITVPRAYEIAAHYRARGIPVVLGGVHATLVPDEAQRYVDVVYQGEAERSWPSLIADYEAGSLKPRYNGGGGPLRNLPLPCRAAYGRPYLMQLVSASRGCAYRCEFCTLWKMEAGQHRTRPPGEVLQELERTARRRPILFTDENIFIDRQWALALFGEMARRGLKRSYAVQASLNIADDEEMLTTLKNSGCMTVLVGFESLSEESLRIMRKGINLKIGVERYREAVERLHDHGLAVSGTFMFGNDGDDPDIFRRTVEFVLAARLDLAHVGLLTPNPGTDLYNRLAAEGRLLYTDFPRDHSRYDLRTAVFRPLKMTPEQLEEGLLWAVRAIGSPAATLRRAWHTWRVTGSPLMAGLALGWNYTGMYWRVVQGHKSARGSQTTFGGEPAP